MIERLEIEFRQRRFAAADFEIGLVVGADRGGGVREIRDGAEDGVGFFGDLRKLGFGGGGLLAQAAAFGFAGLALGRVFCLPIDLLTSLALRFNSSDSACLALRSASRVTNRATSAFEPRLALLRVTSSTFSTMKRRSSMGVEGEGEG